MPEQNRNIPLDIKRELRKEAGFGCCKCGYPFFQYHHIVEYAGNKEHVKENMMVLCPNHHALVTSGAVQEDEQRKEKTNPYNIINRKVEGPIKILTGEKRVNMGGNNFKNNGVLLVVNNEPLITTTYSTDGVLLLSLKLYDKDNNLVAEMEENEWRTDPSIHWDLEAKPQELIIREAQRDIQLRVRTRNAEEIEITGKLWKDKQSILLEPNRMKIDGVVKNAQFFDCSFVNTLIRIDTQKGSLSIGR